MAEVQAKGWKHAASFEVVKEAAAVYLWLLPLLIPYSAIQFSANH